MFIFVTSDDLRINIFAFQNSFLANIFKTRITESKLSVLYDALASCWPDLFDFSSGHGDRVHFSASLALRCELKKEFFPKECVQKWWNGAQCFQVWPVITSHTMVQPLSSFVCWLYVSAGWAFVQHSRLSVRLFLKDCGTECL